MEQEDFQTLLTQLTNPEFGMLLNTFNGVTLSELDWLFISHVPNFLGYEEGDPADNERGCDIRIYIYNTATGEEIAVREFKLGTDAIMEGSAYAE